MRAAATAGGSAGYPQACFGAMSRESDNVYYVNLGLQPAPDCSRRSRVARHERDALNRSRLPAARFRSRATRAWAQSAVRGRRGAYLVFFRSRMIASSASITSSRVARLLLKLSFRLKALLGALKAKT